MKQWGIIKGELCALPLDREDAGPLQPASIKGKEFSIERWGIPASTMIQFHKKISPDYFRVNPKIVIRASGEADACSLGGFEDITFNGKILKIKNLSRFTP
ncbi:MAG: hypothetical protein A3F10_03450 [Coxiella sp. RIFCSPHIGHO2_12_FULL_42_15]|nr:MAG: hypothetical protein A3F10_03450 [Coxiella sp. RIFCSPHIGHO2_12_FULL_42_15]